MRPIPKQEQQNALVQAGQKADNNFERKRWRGPLQVVEAARDEFEALERLRRNCCRCRGLHNQMTQRLRFSMVAGLARKESA